VSFLHPAILTAGLLAIAIPIVIHFIRRRRRPIEWAAMRFLQDALRKRRRRLRLEQLLLLLARCAIVALLAFAIARPTSGRDTSALPTTHIIAIDNSIGSAAESGGRTRLSRSIESALAIIDRAERSPGDTLAVVTLGAPGRAVLWPPTADPGAARRALDRIGPTDSRATTDALSALLDPPPSNGREDPTERTVLHLISGWASLGMSEAFARDADRSPMPRVDLVTRHVPEGPEPSGVNFGIGPLTASTPSVVGSATLAPQTRVSGTMVRSAPPGTPLGPLEAPVELVAHPSGTIAGRTVARFDAGQTSTAWSAAIDESALAPGAGGRVALRATLPGRDPNPLDDRASVVISRKRELRAAVVERPPVGVERGISAGTWALAALSPDDRAGVASFRVDPASLGSIPAGSVDALFILEPARVTEGGWARAAELLARGGLVVITPDRDTGTGANVSAWTEPLRSLSDGQISVNRNAGLIESDERLSREDPGGLLASLRGEFADLIGAVGIRKRLPLIAGPGAVSPIRVQDEPGRTGDPFIAQTSARGTLVVLSTPLDVAWTDLPARPVFVPIVQELVRQGSGVGVDSGVAAGSSSDVFQPTARVDRWDRDPSMSHGALPDERPGVSDSARAGVWLGLGADGQVVRTLTLWPDADAARSTATTPEEQDQAIASRFPGTPISSDAPSGEQTAEHAATGWGDRIAFLLLAVCAALALIEAFLARTASHPAGSSP